MDCSGVAHGITLSTAVFIEMQAGKLFGFTLEAAAKRSETSPGSPTQNHHTESTGTYHPCFL